MREIKESRNVRAGQIWQYFRISQKPGSKLSRAQNGNGRLVRFAGRGISGIEGRTGQSVEYGENGSVEHVPVIERTIARNGETKAPVQGLEAPKHENREGSRWGREEEQKEWTSATRVKAERQQSNRLRWCCRDIELNGYWLRPNQSSSYRRIYTSTPIRQCLFPYHTISDPVLSSSLPSCKKRRPASAWRFLPWSGICVIRGSPYPI